MWHKRTEQLDFISFHFELCVKVLIVVQWFCIYGIFSIISGLALTRFIHTKSTIKVC
jgi:hypothetical protein